ncbi:hypothetical protein CNMCM5793_006822 [Aspergillus hiratsukae]|uniref:Thioesterase domain-containing protein n=1 Tax=Aspergillus hiratsukae TaxID=1194566 RepID=A0A8H6PHJ2_9EURO|nr:hypothetical protein CNMCM5793_006822 [Aspergillus hiratsukae]KAF7173794.1 hypothetical protein CNMCM6106_007892 [Aspergillus hiratsukae]
MSPRSDLEAKRRRKRSDYVFHQEYRTRWQASPIPPFTTCQTNGNRFDNDMYAHLNNTVYAMLFDSIVNSWLIAECGMDPFNRKPSSTSSTEKDSGSSISAQVGIMAWVVERDL